MPSPQRSSRLLATLRAVAVGSVVVAALGCGGGTAPRRPVVVATASELAGVNELLSSSHFSTELRANLFSPLLREQPDYAEHPPTFSPALAASYAWSDDHRTLTFHLRTDAVWSDGVPITAEDVRWSWEAQRSPEVAWSIAEVKEHITDVEVVDPHTARFHFDRVYASQLIDANEGAVLPKHAWGALPFAEWRDSEPWFFEHLVVSGPFTLQRWEPRQEIVLARNPRYWVSGLPRLDRVVFRIIPDETAQIEQLLAGDVDFVEAVPPAAVPRLQATGDVELLQYWPRQYNYLSWNTRRPLFAEASVRRALTLAIDRQGIVDSLWYGHARVAVSPLLTTVWAHDPTLQPWPYDPAAARAALAAAGWEDHDGDGTLDRDGTPFRFELTFNTGNQLRRDAGVLIQEQLRRVGIAVELRPLELQPLIAINEAHDFDATLGAWAIDTALDVSSSFHSREIENGSNYGGYANPEVDRLLDAIRAAPEPGEALPLYHRLEALLHQEQPYTFLWEPERLVGVRRRLQDVRPNGLLTFFNLAEWRLRPAPAK